MTESRSPRPIPRDIAWPDCTGIITWTFNTLGYISIYKCWEYRPRRSQMSGGRRVIFCKGVHELLCIDASRQSPGMERQGQRNEGLRITWVDDGG